MRALPATSLAALAVGLRENSRIKRKLSGAAATREELLLAAAVDRLSLLLWIQTEAGKNGVNRPASILENLLGIAAKEKAVQAFETADEFEAEWARITGVKHGE